MTYLPTIQLKDGSEAVLVEDLMTDDRLREAAPTFENTGVLTHHDLGCRCWPHVSEKDAHDAILAAATAEYRESVKARAALASPSPEPLDRLSPADKDALARMAFDEDTAVSLVEWVEARLAARLSEDS